MFGFENKIVRAALIGVVSLVPATAFAGGRWDRGDRYVDNREDRRDEHRDERRDDDRKERKSKSSWDIDFDIRIGGRDRFPEPREPRYREVTRRVWVEPVYRTVCDRVWREPIVESRCENVWVPEQYEYREVAHRDHCGNRYVVRERVCVQPGYYARVDRPVVVREGYYETVERQVLVSAGYWEERTERVRCD